jgi:hypothetical protein
MKDEVNNFNDFLLRPIPQFLQSVNNDDEHDTEEEFRPVQPLDNFREREIAAQRRLQIIRNYEANNYNNNNNNNNHNNNNNNNNNERGRQRDVPSSASTDSLAEPAAQRPALVDIRANNDPYPLLPIQHNMVAGIEWLNEFLRPKPLVQRAERESFDFYF